MSRESTTSWVICLVIGAALVFVFAPLFGNQEDPDQTTMEDCQKKFTRLVDYKKQQVEDFWQEKITLEKLGVHYPSYHLLEEALTINVYCKVGGKEVELNYLPYQLGVSDDDIEKMVQTEIWRHKRAKAEQWLERIRTEKPTDDYRDSFISCNQFSWWEERLQDYLGDNQSSLADLGSSQKEIAERRVIWSEQCIPKLLEALTLFPEHYWDDKHGVNPLDIALSIILFRNNIPGYSGPATDSELEHLYHRAAVRHTRYLLENLRKNKVLYPESLSQVDTVFLFMIEHDVELSEVGTSFAELKKLRRE